jgi:putative membrane protein
MKHGATIFLAGAALTLGACGKNKDTDETVGVDNDTVVSADNGLMTGNDSAAISPLTAQGFANAAAASDRFEIESSRLAESGASSAAVKRFAAQMISGHTASTEKLKSTVAGMSPVVSPDDSLTPEQQAKLNNLKSLNGTAFDSAYAAAQVEAHQMTLDKLNAYAASGDTPALKTFASGLVPTVTAHLNMAKSLK